MKYNEFAAMTRRHLPPDTVLPNPGGGTSRIVRYSGGKMVYQRGQSKIYLSLEELNEAVEHFCPGRMSSSDLRTYRPEVFDSKREGHSCNCTMQFMILECIGLVQSVEGKGVRGNPFRVSMQG